MTTVKGSVECGRRRGHFVEGRRPEELPFVIILALVTSRTLIVEFESKRMTPVEMNLICQIL